MAHLPYNRCYELKGRSLTAARQLEAYVHAAILRDPPQNSGNMAEIMASWQAFYARHLDALQAADPDLLQATGLLHAELRVKQDAGHYARSYQQYPSIVMSPERTPRYFMYVPVGYTGSHFVPEGAVLLTAQQQAMIDKLLFAEGWLGNSPIFDRADHGVALPPGFPARSPRADFAAKAGKSDTVERAFLAFGKTLKAVHAYEARLQHYRLKQTAAMTAVREAVEATFADLSAVYPHLGPFHVNMSARDGQNGKPGAISVSVRSSADGTPLPPHDGAAFNLIAGDKAHFHEYEVVARSDTAEGRALGAVLADVPLSRPALGQARGLKIGPYEPHVLTQGSYKVLRYFLPLRYRSSPGPGDTRPFDEAALRWLMNDEQDQRRGVVPPPMPAELLAALQQPFGADSASQAPKKTPKRL